MEFNLRTRVKSITLETDDSGREVEKCVLMLSGQPHPVVGGAYLIIEFTETGRGSLHVGQPLELSVTIRMPEPEVRSVAKRADGPRS